MRDYPRLKAIVMANCSAKSLAIEELLRVAEDPMVPPEQGATNAWAEDFAVPLIVELRSQLESALKQADYKPKLIKLVREMRKSQRGKDRELREALEAKVDELVREEVQPSLLGEES